MFSVYSVGSPLVRAESSTSATDAHHSPLQVGVIVGAALVVGALLLIAAAALTLVVMRARRRQSAALREQLLTSEDY